MNEFWPTYKTPKKIFFFFMCEMRRMGKKSEGKEVMLSANGRIEAILV